MLRTDKKLSAEAETATHQHLTPKHHSKITHRSVTHLDRVVPEATDNFVVIILQTVDTLTIFRAALDPLQVVSSTPPVGFYGLEKGGKRWGFVSQLFP